MTGTKRFFVGVALAGFGLVGCSEEPKVVHYREAKAASETPAAPMPAAAMPEGIVAPMPNAAQGVTYQAPAGWEPGRASSMRLASYSVPVQGESADVSLIKLSGGAGGTLANVNRWLGQIALPPVDQAKLDALLQKRTAADKQSYFYMELTNPDNGQAILAGIYERGASTLFAKLTATTAGAQAASEGFKAFCDSVASE